MKLFLAGTDVNLSLPIADRYGNALNATAAEYEVVLSDGTVVVPRAAVPNFNAGDASISITIPASVNQLSGLVPREPRKVNVYCTVDSNVVMLASSYAIEPSDPLWVGVNSFQSFEEAQLIAVSMPNLNGWDAADDQSRIAALIEARLSICRVNFSLLDSNARWGQNSLYYVPEGTYTVDTIRNNLLFYGLDSLTPEQYLKLPERFRNALKLAQVAEADELLGGDETLLKRQSGLIEDSVGESTQRFTTAKVLAQAVSRRAMRYLSPYISYSMRQGRC